MRREQLPVRLGRLAAMPRFHFAIDDDGFEPDPEGTELHDLDEARKQAVVLAGSFLSDHPEAIWDAGELRVEVTDERGLRLFDILVVPLEAPATAGR